MTRLDHSQALFALLGLGLVNLTALNHWALPGMFTVTDVDSATDGSRSVSILRPAPPPEPAPPLAARADPEPPPPAARADSEPLPPPAARVDSEPLPPAASTAAVESEADANAVVLFQRGTWWIGRRGRTALRDSLAQLPQGPVVIEIDGHADARGSRGLNQRISEERAEAVAALLEHAGLSAAQIRVRAFGESRPRTNGNNRRVEIRIRGAQ